MSCPKTEKHAKGSHFNWKKEKHKTEIASSTNFKVAALLLSIAYFSTPMVRPELNSTKRVYANIPYTHTDFLGD